jgi:hypothetical protein
MARLLVRVNLSPTRSAPEGSVEIAGHQREQQSRFWNNGNAIETVTAVFTAMTEGTRRLAKPEEAQNGDDDDDHANDVENVHIRLSAIMNT